jgi:hypothetical protein
MTDSRREIAAFVTGAVCLVAGAAGAATITISSASVQRLSDPARVCVGLVLDVEEQVAGTENLIVWDGECATILQETCAANPAHGKQLSGVIQAQQDFTYKALILSFTDTDPIPAGELYCCAFSLHVAGPGDCCELRVASPGAGDPEGNALATSAGNPGQACLAADGETPIATSTPIQTSTPSPTGMPGSPTVIASPAASPSATAESGFTFTPAAEGTRTPTRASRADGDDDGCAVAAPQSVAWLPWLAGALLLALSSRRSAR